MLGVGNGWLEEEFAILDVPFRLRHRRVKEAIEIIRTAWAGGPFEYHGEFYSFGQCQLTRDPIYVPLILGGNTRRALERAALLGDGWISSRTPSFEDAVDLRQTLLAVRDENGLDAPFRCYCRIARADADSLARYEEAGFEDVIVRADELWPSRGEKQEKLKHFRTAVRELGIGHHHDAA
jgi:alkanesulfonate monooxygenase SsuD/methylene tetrahydromethanopterin reductase-like flavin-dependent oxidoreductase (luciferase family)